MTDPITLPVGHLPMNYTVPCQVIAYDSLNAYASITESVRVIPANYTDEGHRVNDFLRKELSHRIKSINIPSDDSQEAFDMASMFSIVNTFTTAMNSFSVKIALTECGDAGGSNC